MQKSILESLRSIINEVNAVDDLQSVLDITVSCVLSAIGTEVCSIYLREPSLNRLVFMATEGLNKDFIGKVSMAWGEGLVGQVAIREEPINLDDAVSHPNFFHMPGIGEEPFSAIFRCANYPSARVVGCVDYSAS
jgi:phosphotransferase system enzyme I (PtsP)